MLLIRMESGTPQGGGFMAFRRRGRTFGESCEGCTAGLCSGTLGSCRVIELHK